MTTYCGVFEGGGVKGIGLVGALRVAERQGIAFSSVVGTSAGSIVAALYAAGYTSHELTRILWDKRFDDLLAEPVSTKLALVRHKGIYKTDRLYTWVYGLLKAKNVVKFSDLKKQLRIIAADLTNRDFLTFDNSRYSDMKVAEAVQMSATIPGFFRPHVFGEKLVVDGGILSNFPLWAADAGQAPTIGFRLVDEESNEPPARPDTFVRYGAAVFETMRLAHDKRLTQTAVGNCIFIPTGGVPTTKFALTKQEKYTLFRSGVLSARQFFRTFTAPQTARAVGPRVMLELPAVTRAAEYINGHRDAKELAIWGYGLSWAKDILRAVRECHCPELQVLILCPSVAAIEELFEDENKAVNLAKLPGNLEEWRLLEAAGRVRSVKIVELYATPNHHGALIDRDLLLLATYGVRDGGARPRIYPQERALRKVLLYTAGAEEDDLMIEQWRRHLIARASDGTEVP